PPHVGGYFVSGPAPASGWWKFFLASGRPSVFNGSERVLKTARSGDRAYRASGFWLFPVGRVPSRGVRRQFQNTRYGRLSRKYFSEPVVGNGTSFCPPNSKWAISTLVQAVPSGP